METNVFVHNIIHASIILNHSGLSSKSLQILLVFLKWKIIKRREIISVTEQRTASVICPRHFATSFLPSKVNVSQHLIFLFTLFRGEDLLRRGKRKPICHRKFAFITGYIRDNKYAITGNKRRANSPRMGPRKVVTSS